MGAQQGKASSKLNEAECQHLKGLFARIQSNSDYKNSQGHQGQGCSKETFQAHCDSSLDEWLSQKVADLLVLSLSPSKGSASGSHIAQNAFLKFSSTVLKGDFDEKVGIIFAVCSTSVQTEKTISGSSITKYCRSLVESYKKSSKTGSATMSWLACLPPDTHKDDLVFYLLQDLTYPFGAPKDLIAKKADDISAREFTFDEVVTGLGKSMFFQNISNFVFCKCFEFSQEAVGKDIIPNCLKVQPALISPNFTILDLNRVLFLNSLLPAQLRSKWRFLFSSATDGESFSKFLSSIQQKGSTIIIVRDNHERVFGGFASSNWALGPKFFGNPDSFLFHLAPHFASYSSTGYNENFQYLNIQQKTLPNGLGMGGTLEYFGIWIDSEFGKGICSPTCTTFSSPQLSFDKEFIITHLEVWGVGPEPEKEQGVREPQSVLDKDPELRAVLELMGKKTNTSDGYREVPEPPE